MGAILPSSPRSGLLMAPCCGKTLDLVGTIRGGHSGRPLLPHRELSRSALVIGVNRVIGIMMLDLRGSHCIFETKPELISSAVQKLPVWLWVSWWERTRKAHLSYSVLLPSTGHEMCLSWLQPSPALSAKG